MKLKGRADLQTAALQGLGGTRGHARRSSPLPLMEVFRELWMRQCHLLCKSPGEPKSSCLHTLALSPDCNEPPPPPPSCPALKALKDEAPF